MQNVGGVVKSTSRVFKKSGCCKNIHNRAVFQERDWKRDSKSVPLNPTHWRNPTIVFFYPEGHPAYENNHRLQKEIADSSARKLLDYSQRPDKIPMMLATSRNIWSV